jgi:hypothetical protein
MATLGVGNPTLVDLAKLMDPNGSASVVAEILSASSPILDDVTVVEGNLTTGHRTTVRTGLPAPTWRALGGFVTPTKGTVAQVTSTCGMLYAHGEVDVALADMAPDPAAFRMSEDRAHIEGMNIEMADSLFYANQGTAPDEITGLSPHYNSLTAANQENIIRGAGDSDYRSIWLITWSPETIFGITPRNSKAGLQVIDLGKQLIQSGADETSGSTGRALFYATQYRWDFGLCVKDWRYGVRIANIDIAAGSSTFTNGAFATGPDLSDLMYQAYRPNAGRSAWYMSRDMLTLLGRQVSAKTQGSTLVWADVGGRKVETFMGLPIRQSDSLAPLETVVA